MQIIIPMSGFGERFRQEGYSVPKPLIEIDGKPIIAHVIDMFPGETNFIFICNQDHLNEPTYNMRSILNHYCPTGRVLGITPHKYGPIHAVLQAIDYIDFSSSVVVNYCDFSCYWDWNHFKEWVLKAKCMGALPAYRGFHPHTLGTTNYAYIQEKNGWMTDIQEKRPYTDNRMNEYASSGTYYFSSGELMVNAFQETIRQDLHVGREYYVSLAYKFLLANKCPVAIYNLQHFMQWGTPEDVMEYRKWSDIFRHFCNRGVNKELSAAGTVVIPMAGLGQRFVREGYTTTKPLIPVSRRPMVLQATYDLPQAKQYVFVLRRDMQGIQQISKTLLEAYPNALLEVVPDVTKGQACTALVGLDALARKFNEDLVGPITFAACDNGAHYDREKLKAIIETDTDVIVWGARGHANAIRNPQMYGWINCNGEDIKQISVKNPLTSPKIDPIVVGTFIFKRASDFRRCVERMIARDGHINEEFYIDTCINDAISLGLKCKLFEVDSYISWGTPNDLRTFEYWQSCFHKWKTHPYRLDHDSRILVTERKQLEARYHTTVPKLPEQLY